MAFGDNYIYRFTIISKLAKVNQALLDVAGNPKTIKALRNDPAFLKRILSLSEESRNICKDLYDSLNLFTGMDQNGKPQVESKPAQEEIDDSDDIIQRMIADSKSDKEE